MDCACSRQIFHYSFLTTYGREVRMKWWKFSTSIFLRIYIFWSLLVTFRISFAWGPFICEHDNSRTITLLKFNMDILGVSYKTSDWVPGKRVASFRRWSNNIDIDKTNDIDLMILIKLWNLCMYYAREKFRESLILKIWIWSEQFILWFTA